MTLPALTCQQETNLKKYFLQFVFKSAFTGLILNFIKKLGLNRDVIVFEMGWYLLA